MAEQDTSPDADLQLKKRARRRLVGAAALALFAIIVLPMVMDREPRPGGQDIQVRIPSRDATTLAAKVLPGKPAATPMPAPEPKSIAEPVVEPKAEDKTKPEAPAPPAAGVPAPPAVKPAAPMASVTPSVKSAEKPPTAEKAPAKPATEAKPPTEASAQWVVQLGAYKEAGNVKLLMAKLKGVGVPVYTEQFDSPQGPRTRVRAGPFASQAAADKARSRIKIIGVDGPVAPK